MVDKEIQDMLDKMNKSAKDAPPDIGKLGRVKIEPKLTAIHDFQRRLAIAKLRIEQAQSCIEQVQTFTAEAVSPESELPPSELAAAQRLGKQAESAQLCLKAMAIVGDRVVPGSVSKDSEPLESGKVHPGERASLCQAIDKVIGAEQDMTEALKTRPSDSVTDAELLADWQTTLQDVAIALEEIITPLFPEEPDDR